MALINDIFIILYFYPELKICLILYLTHLTQIHLTVNNAWILTHESCLCVSSSFITVSVKVLRQVWSYLNFVSNLQIFEIQRTLYCNPVTLSLMSMLLTFVASVGLILSMLNLTSDTMFLKTSKAETVWDKWEVTFYNNLNGCRILQQCGSNKRKKVHTCQE